MANKINESDKISKRICALCILRILEDYTYKNLVTGEIQSIKIQHEEEPKGIQQRLEEVYKLKVDRGTIKTALADLTTFGIEICEHEPETRKKGNGKAYGYYLNKSALLDAGEYTFITSLISDASFMTEAQKTAIQSKIDKVSSNEYGKTIGLLPKETKYDIFKSDAVLKNFDNVEKAIGTRSKISFTSNKYGIDKQLHPDKTKIKFSPYHIVNSKGKFYIIGKKDGDYSLTHYRMDMIGDIVLLGESFTPDGTNVQRYIDSHPFMSNEKRTVNRCIMNVQIDSIGEIIDEFGLGIDIRTEVRGEKIQDGYCRITLSNVIEEDVCKWALMHSDITEVLAPQSLRERLRSVASILSESKYLQSVEDYYAEAIDHAKMTGHLSLNVTQIPMRKDHELLTEIDRLTIISNDIDSIDFISRYKKLKFANLRMPGVDDYSAISVLPKIQALYIGTSHIKSFEFLRGCDSLRHLHIASRYCEIDDISAIYDATNIECVTLPESVIQKLDIQRLKAVNPIIEIRKYSGGISLSEIKYYAKIDTKFDDVAYPANTVYATHNIYFKERGDEHIINISPSNFVNDDFCEEYEQILARCSDFRKNVVLEMFKNGKTMRECAKTLGTNTEKIVDEIREFGDFLSTSRYYQKLYEENRILMETSDDLKKRKKKRMEIMRKRSR